MCSVDMRELDFVLKEINRVEILDIIDNDKVLECIDLKIGCI